MAMDERDEDGIAERLAAAIGGSHRRKHNAAEDLLEAIITEERQRGSKGLDDAEFVWLQGVLSTRYFDERIKIVETALKQNQRLRNAIRAEDNLGAIGSCVLCDLQW